MNVKMTRRVNTTAVDLIFTLEGVTRRELGAIYNLLPLDERTCSMILLNILRIAQRYKLELSLLSPIPPFRYHFAPIGMQHACLRAFQIISVKYFTLLW